MKSQLAALAASSTSSLVTPGEPYAMFSWTVPWNRIGSWKTTPILSLHDSGVNSRISTSQSMSPGVYILLTGAIKCDFARVWIVESTEQLLN